MKVTVRTFNDTNMTVIAYDVDTRQVSLPGGPRQQVQALAFMALSIAKLLPATAGLLPFNLSAAPTGTRGWIPLSLSITDRRGHEIFAVEPSYSTSCDTSTMRHQVIAALAQAIGAVTPVMSQL